LKSRAGHGPNTNFNHKPVTGSAQLDTLVCGSSRLYANYPEDYENCNKEVRSCNGRQTFLRSSVSGPRRALFESRQGIQMYQITFKVLSLAIHVDHGS
jgi:hypothetical protein